MRKIVFVFWQKSILVLFTLLPFTSAWCDEAKVQVDDHNSIQRALRLFDLDLDEAKRESVYFFDTPQRDLYKKGIILRARIGKKKTDTTIKQRPSSNPKLFEHLSDVDGFKCELDVSPNSTVTSCSLTQVRDSEKIMNVVHGHSSAKKLFNQIQEEFLDLIPQWKNGFYDQVEATAPVDSFEWKIFFEEFDQEVEFCLWKLKNGTQILELSSKTNKNPNTTLRRLIQILDKNKISYSQNAGKTAIALGIK